MTYFALKVYEAQGGYNQQIIQQIELDVSMG
jgi:hypothetical protein